MNYLRQVVSQIFLQVMNAAAKILKEKSEPVHVNVSFEEPLYGQRTFHEPITVEIPQIKSQMHLELDFSSHL